MNVSFWHSRTWICCAKAVTPIVGFTLGYLWVNCSTNSCHVGFFFLEPILIICFVCNFVFHCLCKPTPLYLKSAFIYCGFFKPYIRACTCSVVLCIQLGLKHGTELLKNKVSVTNLRHLYFPQSWLCFFHSFLLFAFVQKYSKYLKKMYQISYFSVCRQTM